MYPYTPIPTPFFSNILLCFILLLMNNSTSGLENGCSLAKNLLSFKEVVGAHFSSLFFFGFILYILALPTLLEMLLDLNRLLEKSFVAKYRTWNMLVWWYVHLMSIRFPMHNFQPLYELGFWCSISQDFLKIIFIIFLVTKKWLEGATSVSSL